MGIVQFISDRADSLLAHATDHAHATTLLNDLIDSIYLSRLTPEEFAELTDVWDGIKGYIDQQWGE